MKESEKSYSDIFEKLLKFANNYFNEYLEFIDEYVRDEDNIKAIADEDEKKVALEIKEEDDFLKDCSDYLEELKEQENKKTLSDEEERKASSVESLLRKLELLDDGEKYDGHLDEWITENTDKNGETWIWYLDNECEGFIREKDNKIVIPHDKEESDEMARNFYIDDHEDEEEIEKEKIKNIMNKIDEEFKNTNINNNDEEEDER